MSSNDDVEDAQLWRRVLHEMLVSGATAAAAMEAANLVLQARRRSRDAAAAAAFRQSGVTRRRPAPNDTDKAG
jgi:hypothetical protein